MALGGCSQTLALHVQMELSLLKATVANYETTAKAPTAAAAAAVSLPPTSSSTRFSSRGRVSNARRNRQGTRTPSSLATRQYNLTKNLIFYYMASLGQLFLTGRVS